MTEWLRWQTEIHAAKPSPPGYSKLTREVTSPHPRDGLGQTVTLPCFLASPYP